MTLVVLPVQPPAVLAGQDNGMLDPAILRTTPGLAGGPTVRLVETAMRCWLAMTAAASADGVILRATSYADSYRTYQVQVATFTARYQVEPTGNGWRLWDSDGNGVRERWYKKDGVNSAAVPGTSNHGWALAVDIANASGTRLDWLEANAVAFGWSWELVPEEPWHVHNFTGDDIPPAVLAYEEDQMTPEQAAALDNVNRMAFANATGAPTVQLHPGNNPTAPLVTIANFTVVKLNELETKVDALGEAIGQIGTDSPEVAAILAGMQQKLDAQQAELKAEIRDAAADLGEGGAAQVRADPDAT